MDGFRALPKTCRLSFFTALLSASSGISRGMLYSTTFSNACGEGLKHSTSRSSRKALRGAEMTWWDGRHRHTVPQLEIRRAMSPFLPCSLALNRSNRWNKDHTNNVIGTSALGPIAHAPHPSRCPRRPPPQAPIDFWMLF